MKKQNLIRIWNDILAAKSVAIACHISPDGDALGSALALARILRHHNIACDVLCQDSVPDNYKFMPEYELVKSETSQVPDLGIIVDCNSLKRVGDVACFIEKAKKTACIDHHLPNEVFGDICYVDEKASSAVEVLMDILLANNVKIDEITACQLMTGLVTDTGVFRFSTVSKKTFEYAAVLVEAGAVVEEIVHYVYECRTMGALKLQGYVLSNIKTDLDGKIAWVSLSKSLLDSFGVSDDETDGVVDHIRKLKGVIATLLIREVNGGLIKVSLRSRDGFDVSKPAYALGGGGHIYASGCTLEMSLSDAEKTVVAEVKKWMVS